MSTVLVIESNRAGSGVRALEAAARRGFETMFCCRRPEDYESFETNPMDVADRAVVTDTLDVATLLRATESVGDPVSVLAYDDLCVVQAAMVGQYFELAHAPHPAGVVRSRFKEKLRERLGDDCANIGHRLVPTTSTASPFGYPCVVKPTDLAGNYGVRICWGQSDYRAACAGIARLAGTTYGRGYRPAPTVLVEEYIPGREYSAELVWHEALHDWALIGITEKEVSGGPNPIEIGHVFPAPLTPTTQEYVLRDLRRVLAIVGLAHTLLHVEFKLTDDGLRVVEINCRPAGGHINELVELVRGVSLVDLHLAAHLGDAAALLGRCDPSLVAGVRFKLPEQSGTVSKLTYQRPTVAMTDLRTHVTSTPLQIDCENLTSDSRLGYVMASEMSYGRLRVGLTDAVGGFRAEYVA